MTSIEHVHASTPEEPGAHFSMDVTGLPEVVPTELVQAQDGDTLPLDIGSVTKRFDGSTIRMLAYNGSIPGPTMRVRQGSGLTVKVTNNGDIEATVHWHGLRLDNKYDGVPYDTQAPIPIGGAFTYRLKFPDPGLYWYHPHVREDYGLDMGLYGTIVVKPSDPSYWPPVDRELTMTLDDLLLEDGKMVPFNRSGPTFTAMGRFGNVFLINGETEFAGSAQVGEVVRLYLVNTANTRIFNVALRGARMKLIGGDSGRYERETMVDEVLLAPSERAIVDVLFETAGQVELEHRTPGHVYTLGDFSVSGTAPGDAARSFHDLRTDPELTAERRAIQHDMTRSPDKVLSFVASMPLLYGGETEPASLYACPMHPDVTSTEPGTCPRCGMALIPVRTETVAPAAYACPMHPEVTSTEPGTCPKCGMKLIPAEAVHPTPTMYACPMHPEVTSADAGICPKCGMKLVPSNVASPGAHEAHQAHDEHAGHEMHHDRSSDHDGEPDHDNGQSMAENGMHEHEHGGDGLEWEDLMPEINRMTDSSNMIWKIIDRENEAVNGAITWKLRVGDRVKIRLVNEMESDHPMHHPFHIHGAGRFLILSRDDVPESNLVWKDTVLVRAGETVDILLDVTNPGLWMAHCHIAEHAQSGMMFSFDVQ